MVREPDRGGSRVDRHRTVDPCAVRPPLGRPGPDRRAVASHQLGRRRDHGMVAVPGPRARAAVRPRHLPVRSAGGHHDATATGERGGDQARQRALQPHRERGRGIGKGCLREAARLLRRSDGRRPDLRTGRGEPRRVGCRDRLPRELHGRANGSGCSTRAAPRLRRACDERPAERLPGLARPFVRQRGGHPLRVRRDLAAHVARPRRRAERLLRPHGSMARRPGLGLAAARQSPGRVRARDHRAGFRRERCAGDRLLLELHDRMGRGNVRLARGAPGRRAAVRPLVGGVPRLAQLRRGALGGGLGRRAVRGGALRDRRLRHREGRGRRRRHRLPQSGAARVRRRPTCRCGCARRPPGVGGSQAGRGHAAAARPCASCR